ncbi:MAG: hypothetical protein R3B06_02935 [Kofleriaceae bacterium]
MKKLLMLIVVGWGAVGIYYGFEHGLPASPRSAYQWGQVAGFGVSIVAVLLGLLSLGQGAGQTGAGTGFLVMVLAVTATAGMMRWRGDHAARDCAAAVAHMRELVVAKDRTGQMAQRFDARRAELTQRCERSGPQQRRCVLAAATFDDLDRCPD